MLLFFETGRGLFCTICPGRNAIQSVDGVKKLQIAIFSYDEG